VLRCGDGFTVLEARPQSGRTNQIRVHLHYAGYPIVGDKVYGVGAGVGGDGAGRPSAVPAAGTPGEGVVPAESADMPETSGDGVVPAEPGRVPTLVRHALHCHSLAFDHPVTKERLHLVAPVPEDLRGFMET
jgi:23S rRNA pseudouridine1911/1915/1917 synthase